MINLGRKVAACDIWDTTLADTRNWTGRWVQEDGGVGRGWPYSVVAVLRGLVLWSRKNQWEETGDGREG